MGIKFSQLPIASSVASDDYIAVLDSSESVLKRTPINHASQGSAYGLSTTTEYGHAKIVDNLSQSSLTNGEALSSRQGNVIANDMGQVELTSTAAYAHTQGSYFIFIGQFVKCIQAISVGDTINLGTNVEATSIGAVLGQLNSKVGSVDISDVGASITGAISNLSSDLMKLTEGSFGEFGTFIPSLKNCTATYTKQIGMYYRIDRLVYVAVSIRGDMTAANGAANIDISDMPSRLRQAVLTSSSYVLGSARMYSNVLDLKTVYTSVMDGEISLRSSPTGTANWRTGDIYLDIETVYIHE